MSRKMKHGKWSEVVFATVLFLGAAGLLVLRFSISQNDLWQICGLLSALAAFLIIVLVGLCGVERIFGEVNKTR